MWVFITLVAVGFQIARTSEQHRLREVLDVAEAGYVRFVYALPIAAMITAAWVLGPGVLPTPTIRFFGWITLGGIAQILATVALLQSFRLRDFAVGTTYAKTEPLFVGAASALLLDEPLSALSWFGVAISLCGVVWLASGGTLRSAGLDPAALFGALAGLGFGLAAVGIRAASSDLDGSVVDRALLTLTTMLAIQTVLQGSALAASSTSSLMSVAKAWRKALFVAGLSLAGSVAWAVALTLENAARVRTLGQVEIVFAFAIGVLAHHESHKRSEYAAGLLAAAGLTLIVVA